MAGLPHAETNAALLPHTAAALRERLPDDLARLDERLPGTVEELASLLRDRADARDLGDLGTDDELLERTVATAADRPELQHVSPPLSADEVRAIYRRAAAG
jgi:alcohol dehydrogenase class IV